jgi:ribosomal protein L14E/L6E/L27E
VEAIIGRIVRSCAGRDSGSFLIIIRTDDSFVYVADGKERKLASPKKKSLKHLKLTNTVIDTKDLTDKKLRSVIAEFAKAPDN